MHYLHIHLSLLCFITSLSKISVFFQCTAQSALLPTQIPILILYETVVKQEEWVCFTRSEIEKDWHVFLCCELIGSFMSLRLLLLFLAAMKRTQYYVRNMLCEMPCVKLVCINEYLLHMPTRTLCGFVNYVAYSCHNPFHYPT